MIFKKQKNNNLKQISIEEEVYLLLRYKSLKENKDYSQILREVLE